MKQFFDFVFMFILMAVVIFFGICLAQAIGESDLPFWVKYWLLK